MWRYFLVQRAKEADLAAREELGLAYSSLQQYRRSAQWWRRAAEQGYAPAQVNLGLRRLIGVGASKNPWDACLDDDVSGRQCWD